MKTAAFGYDGKGGIVSIGSKTASVWGLIGHQEAIIERLVDFTHEISVVAARGLDGQFAHYGRYENVHHNHILDLTVAPRAFPAALPARRCISPIAYSTTSVMSACCA